MLPNQFFSISSIDSIQIQSKSLKDTFWLQQIDSKIYMKSEKKKRIANKILKKNQVGGLTSSNTKPYYKAAVILSVWYCIKEINCTMDQNREPQSRFTQIRPTYLTTKWRKDSPFDQWCGENKTHPLKLIYNFHKNYGEWIIALNVKCKVMKLLEDNIGEN